MAEPRRGLTAEERFAALQRDRAVLRRERLLCEAAGPCWHRMVRIVPVLFRREGTLAVRALLAEPAVVAPGQTSSPCSKRPKRRARADASAILPG